MSRCHWWRAAWIAALVFVACLAPRAAGAADVLMKDGRILKGKLGEVAGLAELPVSVPAGDSEKLRMIVFLDDDLRRTFVPWRQIAQVQKDSPAVTEERFALRQRVQRNGLNVRNVGPSIKADPFDEWGRRSFHMLTEKGTVTIIQGMTEITPKWIKVEGFRTSGSCIWPPTRFPARPCTRSF